jgi:hypothetical protein
MALEAMMTKPLNGHDNSALLVLRLVFVMLIVGVLWLSLLSWWQGLPSHQFLPPSR